MLHLILGFCSCLWLKEKIKVMNGVVISCQVETVKSETIDLKGICSSKTLPLEETGQNLRGISLYSFLQLQLSQ